MSAEVRVKYDGHHDISLTQDVVTSVPSYPLATYDRLPMIRVDTQLVVNMTPNNHTSIGGCSSVRLIPPYGSTNLYLDIKPRLPMQRH